MAMELLGREARLRGRRIVLPWMARGARFDHFDGTGDQAFVLRDEVAAVTARSLDEVHGAIADAESAADDGRWVAGYVAYEAAPAFDEALDVRSRTSAHPTPDLPLAHFSMFAGYEEVAPFRARADRPAPYTVSTWKPSVDRGRYVAAVATIREHIAAGDVYQVNHTFRLHAAFGGDPLELYRDLVLAQRGAYGAYLDLGRFHVLSASPERFIRIEGNAISTRPMKGTARRGRWAAEDEARKAELVASEKDRAENLMIVDLLRNDLGRVAEFGSVNVDELFALERYETVWQMTSEISARVRRGTDLAAVFAALFPSGSVTGAPKTRAMEIIADLEDSPRGVYCGAVGFIAPPGAPWAKASFNVGIRTVTIDTGEGIAEYGVGGGITWDSSEVGEYEEARAKARVLVDRRPEFELLETMRWEPSHGWWWLDRHLSRLSASARYFGFTFDRDRIDKACATAVDGAATPARVRLTLARDGAVVAEADPVAEALSVTPGREVPVVLAVDDEPVHPDDVFLYHKTTLRRPYLVRQRRHVRADDVVMLNERGEVTETTVGNIVALVDGRWVTPPLASGCLPGVMRSVLLDEGVIIEAPLTITDLRAADEIGVINSVRGWQRARVDSNL
jgi:para-aminobenzoate synthetase/4-amino-4-deoxychorismate lyase